MTHEERQYKIDIIRQFPALLTAELEKLSEGDLDAPCDEGLWTVRQVIHHIADSHINAFVRTKLILTENNPPLKPYDQDEWVKLVDSSTISIQSSLTILVGLHERWTAVLQSLPEFAFYRTGVHPEHGPITLDFILSYYAQHGQDHLDQLKRR